MTTTLLATKLYAYATRPEFVFRPRLFQQLNDSLPRKLTLISGPPGFGKTTLVTEWLRTVDRPFAWLTLDEGDNDPVRFVTYLVAALQRVDENIGQTAQGLLASPQLPPPGTIVTTLINDIMATPQPFTLVLDDYHAIQTEWIHEAVEFLIANQPPDMHLILATRVDPPLSLPRLRVRNQVTEIREGDLRFTSEESAAFLNQALGLTLDADLITALERRTEGWIAGLQLAALSMRGKPAQHQAAFVEAFSGSHRHVIDYLADEVLAQQPEETRDFLRQTAILDRLTASLCDAITGRANSNVLLRQLEHANLFLIPLDEQREWYRYHHLFADFLRTELDEKSQATLHLKAARWLAAHDLLTEAVKHVLASKDMNEATRIVSLAAEEALRNASLTTLLGWFDSLPDELVRSNSQLAMYKAFALYLTNRHPEAITYTDAAEELIPKEAPSSSRGRLLSLKALMALCNDDPNSVIQLSEQALDCFDEGDAFFHDLTLNVLGQVLEVQGDVAAAADVYRTAISTKRKAGDQLGALILLVNLTRTLNELGRRREAIASCQQFIEEYPAQPGRMIPMAEGVDLALSRLYYEANELEMAREQASRALAISKQSNISDGILLGYNILGWVQLASGEINALLKTCHEAREYAGQLGRDRGTRNWFAAMEAEAYLQQGDLVMANRWAEEARLTPEDTPNHWDESVHFTYVRLLLAQNRLEDAQILLTTMEDSGRQGGLNRRLITTSLQQALIQEALGHREQALVYIKNALRLAAPEDYLRAFLDEGPVIASLLPHARHAAPMFVDRLLEAFGEERGWIAENIQIPSSPISASPSLVEPLSERELEILQLIAAGRSNPEIAELLYLSLNTVKWHAKNLYSKLQASNRVEVVARAQELGLL